MNQNLTRSHKNILRILRNDIYLTAIILLLKGKKAGYMTQVAPSWPKTLKKQSDYGRADRVPTDGLTD